MGKAATMRKAIAALPGVPLLVRPSAQARRITLRVSALDGRVTLTVPRGTAISTALDFAEDRADWIRAQLDRQAQPVAVVPGVVLPVAGVPHEVVTAPRAGLGAGFIAVRPDGGPGPQAAALLRDHARRLLVSAAEGFAAREERRIGRITLRDTRSRWGSCSSEGNLMFSWRLVLAPRPVLDYVAAHEVAHLVRMDHSRAFWAVVTRLMPDHAAPRRWLQEHGAALHAWRFDG
ncbi:hypothetical protein LX81_00856 [Palleronia aestuarii]|uniref:YgjP-like metallopeptidase domain-containing protein n=1 Tax=Palleronia aestuarii TaxID=568105 RepID=A0A2W7NJI1_9RHOB|nr:SprT family zinc-dependent metalloprotease [Palleronia aestuarii]PZX18227.1 hypothetical protein LX81_00856 [Palleronia aestuarii]